jgi:hypothetical protein
MDAPPPLPVENGRALAVGAAGLIGWWEIDRLITGAVSPDGESRSLNGFLTSDRWELWAGATTSAPGAIARWIIVASLFDVLFFWGYLTLLTRWVGGRSRVARYAIRVLWIVEIAESVLLVLAAAALWIGEVPWLIWVPLVALTAAKWLVVAVALIAAVRSESVRRCTGRWIARAFEALRVQRLSLVVVVVLGALSLVPVADLFDQFPDVLRAWFDTDYGWASWHLIVGVLSFLVGGVALFFLGRQRSERSWTTRVGADRKTPGPKDEAEYRWWLAGPVVAGLVALGLWMFGPEDSVDLRVLGVFAGVPLFLVVVSGVIGRVYRKRGVELWAQQPPDVEDRRGALDVWLAGDLLAAGVPMIGALALVRALVAPVVVDVDAEDARWVIRLAVLTGAMLVVFAGFPAAAWLARRPHKAGAGATGVRKVLRPDARSEEGLLYRGVPQCFWGGAIVILLVMAVFPLEVSTFLGVVATAVLALVAWALFFGLLIVHMQFRRPLKVFRWLRMRANPILSLFVLVPAAASLWGGVAGLHTVRSPADAVALPDRPTIEEWFRTWQTRGADCSYAAGGQEIRPMVVVAASGGGIRAATWTAGVMQRLDEAGDCAAPSVFLSSGVSGGSVGLAVGRGDDPEGDVERLARPPGLSAALTGLLVGDLVAGSSGVRIPSVVDRDVAWRDRAALMETVWERDASVLGETYDATPRGSGGMLVFNSTSTNSGCRVLVSQLELVSEEPRPDDLECVRAEDDLPASVDLQALYGDCTPAMTWATAAMLSARFATVTSSGRVPPEVRDLPDGRTVDCGSAEEMQLIDGGYAETSGVGTLADLAPMIMREVVAYNATRGSAPPVVPIVLYLEDEPRKEIARDPGGLTAELVVPRTGTGAGDLQTSTTTWLQRVGLAYSSPCGSPDEAEVVPEGDDPDGEATPVAIDQACLAAVEAIHGRLTDGVVVAAPLTAPAVEAPLGWTLSPDSRERMRADLKEQVEGCTDNARPGRYACLSPLLDVLKGAAQGDDGAAD